MAKGKVTGATKAELVEMREEHRQSPLYEDHDIPLEVSYCLTRIGKQPDGYDGPDRYCKNRAIKRDEDDYEGGPKDEAAYAASCRFHGGDLVTAGKKTSHLLDNPRTAPLEHGLYAEDKSLLMDLSDEEQQIFDKIVEEWPEIYDWPPKSEDPARYRLLRRVAVAEVRSVRAEDYLDERGEVYEKPIYDERGQQIGSEEVENPLAREFRLLMKEITSQMAELGLTPKSRQRLDTMESEQDRNDALGDIASEALGSSCNYDPSEFDNDE